MRASCEDECLLPLEEEWQLRLARSWILDPPALVWAAVVVAPSRLATPRTLARYHDLHDRSFSPTIPLLFCHTPSALQ